VSKVTERGLVGWPKESLLKEAVVEYFEILSLHIIGRTEENHEKKTVGIVVSAPRLEPETCRILRRRIIIIAWLS
jgi:hypothetical protein